MKDTKTCRPSGAHEYRVRTKAGERPGLMGRWAAVGCLALAGCVAPAPGAGAGQPHCDRYKNGTPPYDKPRYRICTTQMAPSIEADAQAKRFEPTPGMATLYVVRRNWADIKERLPVELDGRQVADTVPRTMLRIVLPPGAHAVALEWHGMRLSQAVQLDAGEVRFVGLRTEGWPWGRAFTWAQLDPAQAKDLALGTRLVADLRVE